MLPKNRRISKEPEWNKLHKFGKRTHTAELVMSYLKTKDISRFGFIVGAKVSKRANVRNLIKRRIRSVIEKNLPKISENFDIIFIAKPAVVKLDYNEIEKKVLYLLSKNNFLKK